MATNIKFIRQYGKYRKNSVHRLQDKIAVYFIDNSIGVFTCKSIEKDGCVDCESGCKDCQSKKKRKTPKKENKTLTKKKAPKK
tara:strand:+ start:8928 stop:9176 length:249 start_codon:yes stop_codon:yes gene_type:complete